MSQVRHMAPSHCPEFEVLVNWLEQPALGRTSEISDHVAACERCTAMVAAGAAEFRTTRVVEPIADVVGHAAKVGPARARRRLRPVALWAAIATLAIATGFVADWRSLEVVSSIRDSTPNPPIAEWTRQEIVEFVMSGRSHETNALAEILYRCRDERIDEAVPRALRLYRQTTTPAPGVVAKHVIAARAFIASYTPQEIETALKQHGNVWMTYDRYTRELNEKGGNR